MEKQMSNANLFGSKPSDRVAVFFDGANLFASTRALDVHLDYSKLTEALGTGCNMMRMYYYTALPDGDAQCAVRPLVDWLDYNGYTMVTKPTKEFTDSATGLRKIKGNMDIEIAIDVMEMAPHLDHVILFSGDGDFRRLVEAVQRKGVRVTVVSTVKSNPSMIADELRRQADKFVELADIMSYVVRDVREK